MRFFPLLLSLFIAACAPAAEQSQAYADGAVVRLSGSDARSLDPQMVADVSSNQIATDQFEGLTRMDVAGQPEPGLASKWQVSDDGLIWDFALRPDILFSDGTPITGEVFVRALERIRAPDSGSPHVALFDVIDRIELPNANIVRVILKDPFPQLPALLCYPAMAALPFHIIDSEGDKWTSQRPMVTSSAYRLTDWKLAQAITLEANPRWHGGAPKTDKIIWQPMENAQSAMRLMLAGGGDTSNNFPANRLNWLKENHGDLLRLTDALGTYYFIFNLRKPPFDDLRVRRALSMTVDRTWIAKDMIAAGNDPAYGFVPPALSGERLLPPKTSMAERRREARRLLAEAGYNVDNPLQFEIRFNTSPEHRRVATSVTTMWREIGVEAKLLNSEAGLHFDALRRGEFSLARIGWIADLPAPENFLYIHTQGAGLQNYSGYASPDYEAALARALKEQDAEKRAALMRAAEAILLADAPLIPIYYYTSRNLVQPNIGGWENNIADTHPSRYLYRKTQ